CVANRLCLAFIGDKAADDVHRFWHLAIERKLNLFVLENSVFAIEPANLGFGEDLSTSIRGNILGDDICADLAVDHRPALLLAALDEDGRLSSNLEGGVIFPGEPLAKMKDAFGLSCPVIAADVRRLGDDPDLA